MVVEKKEAPKVEAKAEIKVLPKVSDGLIKVKNISKKVLNLSTCVIQIGENGKATKAEYSTLYKYLEKV